MTLMRPGAERSVAGRLRGAVAWGLLASTALGGRAFAQDDGTMQLAQAEALGRMTIDELAQVSVTSVSRRPEPIGHAASSVYVITSEAIRASGAPSIPEALRQAPNLEVMRIDALDYSISARGFAGFESANKLLVLMDGRSVYTPLFSGVDWDQHHTLMEDIDRIEVISGPGGTLWGANAVNGVVSITTKSAFDTEGTLATARLGTLDSDVALRVGRGLGASGAGRVYATAFRRGDLREADGDDGMDGWDGWQAGFRTDWAGDRDSFTFQGDIQDATIAESLGAASGYVRGGNLLGRWTRRTAGGATFEVQAYYDQIEREARLVRDELRVWDIEAQHAFASGRHRIVWGGGYRVTKDEFRTLFGPQLLSPPRRQVDIANLFVQDEVALTPDLLLTVGVKVEANTYTEAELMPSARFAWRVSERQFLWGAVSRAIRNPSRIERDFAIPGVVEPGRMGSEKLTAYEAGYRGWVSEWATASVTVFYHDYDDLRTNELTPPGVLPIYVGNRMEGETYGIEAWFDYDVRPWWRLSAGGVRLEKDFRLKPGSLDIAQFEAAGADPEFWFKVGSQMRLGERTNLDLHLRVYDDIPRLSLLEYVGADGYAELDARLSYQLTDRLEVALEGRNLLHDQHAEASEARRMEIPRSVALGLRWAH